MQDNFRIDQFMINEFESPLKLCSLFFMQLPEKVRPTFCQLYFMCLASHLDTWHHFKPYTVPPHNSEPHSINITQLTKL